MLPQEKQYYVLDTLSRNPKGISSKIGPILQRCKNIEKIGNVFDMKLIKTVKYVVSNRGSHKSLPLWILCLGYTLEVPQDNQ